ncbi:hypothetical protein E1301_Tti016306 [Triplophysa tibetana]|uniref:Uncharacterized protein n=1 Tax=Triplophysa tibetana TaxID=1572043 RepID=A0A5A9MWT9_9TELE|nr:hypothetical protein E1301_Tti016306 [Triplophysa tibetana]
MQEPICKHYITLTVINTLTHPSSILTYSTFVIKGGALFGALNNLQDSKKGFSFTYTIHKIYGLYLESVNNVKGSKEDHTFWELLTETPSGEEPLKTGFVLCWTFVTESIQYRIESGKQCKRQRKQVCIALHHVVVITEYDTVMSCARVKSKTHVHLFSRQQRTCSNIRIDEVCNLAFTFKSRQYDILNINPPNQTLKNVLFAFV